jgi:AcrR family transcriptional regulator
MTASEATPARPLPRGPHRLAREEVVASQRGRMLDALAESVAAKGYAATTVGDVVAGAGVSRKTFYEHFDDKEAAFVAAWDAGVDRVLTAIRAGRDSADNPLERLRFAIRAYLNALADRPAFARAFLIEVVAAGPQVEARRADVHRRFAEMIRRLHAEARQRIELPELPDEVYPAIVGLMNELVSERVRAGRTEELPQLEDSLVYLQLVLFAGHETAAAEASARTAS